MKRAQGIALITLIALNAQVPNPSRVPRISSGCFKCKALKRQTSKRVCGSSNMRCEKPPGAQPRSWHHWHPTTHLFTSPWNPEKWPSVTIRNVSGVEQARSRKAILSLKAPGCFSIASESTWQGGFVPTVGFWGIWLWSTRGSKSTKVCLSDEACHLGAKLILTCTWFWNESSWIIKATADRFSLQLAW